MSNQQLSRSSSTVRTSSSWIAPLCPRMHLMASYNKTSNTYQTPLRSNWRSNGLSSRRRGRTLISQSSTICFRTKTIHTRSSRSSTTSAPSSQWPLSSYRTWGRSSRRRRTRLSSAMLSVLATSPELGTRPASTSTAFLVSLPCDLLNFNLHFIVQTVSKINQSTLNLKRFSFAHVG